MPDADDIIKCHCGHEGPRSTFPKKKSSVGHVKTCQRCTKYAKEYRQIQKQKKLSPDEEKENKTPAVTAPPEEDSQRTWTWAALKTELSGVLRKACHLDVEVELPEDHKAQDLARPRKERVKLIRDDLQAFTKLHFK